MKILARCLIMFVVISLYHQTFADDWVSYRENYVPITEQKITYIIPQFQPVVYYQPIPYVIYQNIIVEKQCFLHRTQTVIARPVTQYYYQPVILYR